MVRPGWLGLGPVEVGVEGRGRSDGHLGAARVPGYRLGRVEVAVEVVDTQELDLHRHRRGGPVRSGGPAVAASPSAAAADAPAKAASACLARLGADGSGLPVKARFLLCVAGPDRRRASPGTYSSPGTLLGAKALVLPGFCARVNWPVNSAGDQPRLRSTRTTRERLTGFRSERTSRLIR